MKHSATILMSMLLVGVCFARSLDDSMRQREVDYSKVSQDNRREDEQSKADEQNTQQWTQLRETVYQKLRNMYQQMTSGNAYPIEDLPELADPLYIGQGDGQFAMFGMQYENVQFQGLGSAYQGFVNVDTSTQTATMTLNLKTAEIRGKYEANSPKSQMEGKFTVQMSGDLSYTCTYRYEPQAGNKFQLLHVGSKLIGTPVSQYENANSSDFIQGPLRASLGSLVQTIEEKIHTEVHPKMSDRIIQFIQETRSGQQQDSSEKVMGESIKNTIHGIQQVLSKRGVFSIDLTSEDKEVMHNKLHAKIASVKLNGLEKLYLANHQVSKENSDKIRAKIQLAINKPTATALVNIHESHADNAPFQKINVDFDMEGLMAELALEKPARQSGLELHSVETKVNRIRPMNIEKFESKISNLIKEKLASHMKHYVEESLKTFIQNEYVFIKSRGVMPPAQEKQIFRNQM